MSLLPIQTIETLRQHQNTIVDIYGFDCKLFIKENYKHELNSIYNEDLAPNYKELDSKVFIKWAANTRELKKIGIFVEGDIPIVAFFKNDLAGYGLAGGSYIKIDINYAPDKWKTDKFEIIACLIQNMYNASVIKAYSIVPKRGGL